MPKTRPTKPHIPDFASLARRLRATANDALHKGVVEYADSERDRFVRKIELQAFASFKKINYPESGTNLSPNWLDQKERKGADERTMIATTWYKSNIKVWVKKGRSRRETTIVRIGFHPRTMARDLDHKITDTPLWLVATYNELGSLDGNLPARPHWGPHFRVMHSEKGKTRRLLRDRVKTAIKRDPKLKNKLVVT